MDSVAVTVPLRPPTKKMKKRKELDALAPPRAITRRNSGKRSSQELLTDSSDDRSEYWSTSARSGRKCRGRRNRACPGLLRACSAFLACASILAIATLIWLFIDVRQQLGALRTELDQARAGSEGLPEELQKSQSLSKDLKNNQTVLFSQLADLKSQLANFTTQLTGIQTGLHEVETKLQAAPELVNIPKTVDGLASQVVRFGSEFGDLRTTVDSLKASNAKLLSTQTSLTYNLTKIEQSLALMPNFTQQPQPGFSNETEKEIGSMKESLNQLAANLTSANKTLALSVDWVGKDVTKNRKKLMDLEEAAQNLSTKVISLEQERVKLLDESQQVKNINIELTNRLNQLEISYNALKNATSEISTSIIALQSSKATDIVESVAPAENSPKLEENQYQTSATNTGPTDVSSAKTVRR